MLRNGRMRQAPFFDVAHYADHLAPRSVIAAWRKQLPNGALVGPEMFRHGFIDKRWFDNAIGQLIRSLNVVLPVLEDRKSTRLNSSHLVISYAVFCLKK